MSRALLKSPPSRPRAARSVPPRLDVLRRRVIGEGTFPSEILTCRKKDGSTFAVFQKTGGAHDEPVHGHKGGVGYELEVYRRVLRSVTLPLPKLLGGGHRGEKHWLQLEALEGCYRTHVAADPDAAMASAARWIGQFHAQVSAPAAKRAFPKIIHYSRAYYMGWAQRTEEYSSTLRKRYPWLKELCRAFAGMADELRAAPQCVIHGEYYPKNILWRDGTSFPVDWESAAIAPGEVDLASLAEGWSHQTERLCEQAYCEARWDDDPPPSFSRTLTLARIYQSLRWLGDRPEWTTANHMGWQFKRLRQTADSLALL